MDCGTMEPTTQAEKNIVIADVDQSLNSLTVKYRSIWPIGLTAFTLYFPSCSPTAFNPTQTIQKRFTNIPVRNRLPTVFLEWLCLCRLIVFYFSVCTVDGIAYCAFLCAYIQHFCLNNVTLKSGSWCQWPSKNISTFLSTPSIF